MHFPEFISSEEKRKRYWARSMAGWRAFSKAAPNQVHQLLAQLEDSGSLHHLLTQNVDGLHQRAGSNRVVDLHGRLDEVVCLDCGARTSRAEIQDRLEAQNPDWAYEVKQIAPDGDVDLERVDYARFQLVACDRCGGVLKPDVVFFGENVPKPRVEFVLARLREADALLVGILVDGVFGFPVRGPPKPLGYPSSSSTAVRHARMTWLNSSLNRMWEHHLRRSRKRSPDHR